MTSENVISEIKDKLEDHEKRIKKIEDFIKNLESKPPIEELSGIKKLSKKTGVNEKVLKKFLM